LAKEELVSEVVGEKWDDGKIRFSLVPWKGVEAVGEVAMYGLRKGYKKDSWKFVEGGFERYKDALVRHLVKELVGEHVDPESGLPHLYHVAWNALAVCHFLMEGKQSEKQ
jgi:hypothetical protein